METVASSVPAEDQAAVDDYPDPRDFYASYHHDHSLAAGAYSEPRSIQLLTAPPTSITAPDLYLVRSRSAERSPTRRHHRRASSPSKLQVPASFAAESIVDPQSASRPAQKNIKDLVNRFNKDADRGERPLVPPTLKDKHKRTEEQRAARLMKPRSPVKMRYPVQSQSQHARDHIHMPSHVRMHLLETAEDLYQSASYDKHLASLKASSPPKRKMHQPALPALAHTGNGARDFDDASVPPPNHVRRGSDGSIMKSPAYMHHAAPPHESLFFPQHANSSSGSESSFRHSRSHSDQPYVRHDSHQWPSAPQHDLKHLSIPHSSPFIAIPSITSNPVPSQQGSYSRQDFQASPERGARTPANKYHKSTRETTSHMLHSPGRKQDSRLPQSPARLTKTPAAIPSPPPQRSPPPRNSRPRQPVTLATTAASRARATERFNKQEKPVQAEPVKQRQRRRIPELGRVDFAERRARIEKALSQNLDDKSDFDSRSSRNSSRRRSSVASTLDRPIEKSDEDGMRSISVPALDQVVENPLSPLFDQPRSTKPIVVDAAEDTEFEEDAPVELPEKAYQTSSWLALDSEPSSIQATPVDHSIPLQTDEPRLNAHNAAGRPTGPASSSELNAEIMGVHSNLEGDIECHARPVASPQKVEVASTTDMRTPAIEGSEVTQYGRSNDEPASDEDAALYRPRTPIDQSLLQTSPESSDLTPRHFNDLDEVTPQKLHDLSRRPSDTPEKFMQRAIQEYEHSGRIDPELLHQLERSGIINAGPDGRASSDVATIRVLLDRFSFRPQPRVTTDDEAVFSPAKYVRNSAEYVPPHGQIASGSSAHSREDTYASGSDGASRSFTEWRDDRSSSISSNDSARRLYHDLLSRVPTDSHGKYDGRLASTGQATPLKDNHRSVESNPRYSSGVPSLQPEPPSPPSSTLKRVSDYSFSLPEIEVGGSFRTGLGLDMGSPFEERASQHPATPPPRPSIDLFDARREKGDTLALRTEAVYPPKLQRRASEPSSPQSRSNAAQSILIGAETLRPSQESQRAGSMSNPTSHLSSFSQMSLDASSTDYSSPTPLDEQAAPTELQRRLLKRRNIIKELVDTEYSYHQDIKIIEDIYKATCGDILSSEDKKVLFGNADQIEILSLEFYDSIRRAVSPFYVVQKSTRWTTKRASYTTASSTEKDPSSVTESCDEDTDKLTAVGAVFERYLARMERVYGAYVKNHEAANKRLVVLQADKGVTMWLKACHSNASDITSAWDLDSLLVKPVQRFLKYPLLLQQLLSITPEDHPDHAALRRATEESTSISQRINEAKKRADLVESIVNRKRKDSELRSGLAKAFGLRSEKVKERIGIKNDYQDPIFEELSMKFGGHYVRLQVVMRDVQASLTEVDRTVERFNAFAQALEQFMELGINLYPDIEAKWRRLIGAVRQLTGESLPEHKEQVKKRIIEPMVTALKLHEGPQNVMAKRKKRIIDYVRCRQMEKAGQKPDKKTAEGSELYIALNDQLKIDLPKLYELTALLIQRCLACHHQIQLAWLWTWEMKLRPVLDDFPESMEQILPEFHEQYDLVDTQVYSLGLCNGTLLADAAMFLSPQTSFTEEGSGFSRPRAGSSRTHSIGSEYSGALYAPDLQRGHSMASLGYDSHSQSNLHSNASLQTFQRSRSSSQISAMGRPRTTSVGPSAQPLPHVPSQVNAPTFSPSPSLRPNDSAYLSNTPAYKSSYNRLSAEVASKRSPRPESGSSSFSQHNTHTRTSGIYSSAMPMADGNGSAVQPDAAAVSRRCPAGQKVLFVCASLYDFPLDRVHMECGIPYHSYVQGEIFDVIAHKGELWLAKNQDDAEGLLGWIWEQHFVEIERPVDSFAHEDYRAEFRAKANDSHAGHGGFVGRRFSFPGDERLARRGFVRGLLVVMRNMIAKNFKEYSANGHPSEGLPGFGRIPCINLRSDENINAMFKKYHRRASLRYYGPVRLWKCRQVSTWIGGGAGGSTDAVATGKHSKK